ncbi:MAG: hypothetical protein FWB74_06170 [Defluviitaleaceae bacterium]|nr:hypothetical protein [Defluviitaleaceae bacterium]
MTRTADRKLLHDVIDALPQQEFNAVFNMLHSFIADFKNDQVSDDDYFTGERLERLLKAKAQVERGEVVTKTLEELEAMVNEK